MLYGLCQRLRRLRRAIWKPWHVLRLRRVELELQRRWKRCHLRRTGCERLRRLRPPFGRAGRQLLNGLRGWHVGLRRGLGRPPMLEPRGQRLRRLRPARRCAGYILCGRLR